MRFQWYFGRILLHSGSEKYRSDEMFKFRTKSSGQSTLVNIELWNYKKTKQKEES